MVIFKDTRMNNHINGGALNNEIIIDTDVYISLSSTIIKLRSLPVFPSYPKQVWNYLKQGLVYTVWVECSLSLNVPMT